MHYTKPERFGLWILAAAGFLGLNGVFLWAFFTQPETAMAVLQHPVAAALMIEALLLTGVLAYLLPRWRVSQVHWVWFVLLALAGGLAFAVPVVMLWSDRASRSFGRDAIRSIR